MDCAPAKRCVSHIRPCRNVALSPPARRVTRDSPGRGAPATFHSRRVWLTHRCRPEQDPAPNQLLVADFTYVRIGDRFACTAFVIDAFAGNIVGW